MPPKPLGRHQKRRAESDQDGKRGDIPGQTSDSTRG